MCTGQVHAGLSEVAVVNLRALETLVAIGETQSFVEAARRLGISQSTVSMQIKALEEELEVELFDRSVRPPLLSLAGLAIVASARDVVARVEDIRRCARMESGLTGTLRLGAVQTATLALLPECVASTVRRHPGLTITIESGLSAPLIEQVRERLLDASVVTEPPETPPELNCELILRERLALVFGSDLQAGALGDVERYPFIRFNRRIGVGAIVDRFLATKRVAPTEFMELDSIEAILAMVERGLGVAIVPERSIGPSNRHRVQLAPIEDADAYRNVSFVFRVDSVKTRLLDVVLEGLREAAHRM
jgi:DNA-binding transcriptional LysR family regulator